MSSDDRPELQVLLEVWALIELREKERYRALTDEESALHAWLSRRASARNLLMEERFGRRVRRI